MCQVIISNKSFFSNSLRNSKQNIKNLEDILREGRKLNPGKKVSELFSSINGAKIMSLCFTQWKIAFIQKWIQKDMNMLHSYRIAKAAIKNIREFISEKKSTIQEFHIKRDLLLKVR